MCFEHEPLFCCSFLTGGLVVDGAKGHLGVIAKKQRFWCPDFTKWPCHLVSFVGVDISLLIFPPTKVHSFHHGVVPILLPDHGYGNNSGVTGIG